MAVCSQLLQVMGGAMALLGGLGLGFAKEDPDDSSKVDVSLR